MEKQSPIIYHRKNPDAIFRQVAFILVTSGILVGGLAIIFFRTLISKPFTPTVYGNKVTLNKFSSNAEFYDYLTETEVAVTLEVADQATRVSQTNVQFLGIDEPDIVKTDGKNIYYSKESLYYITQPSVPEPAVDSLIFPVPPREESVTNIIRAFPVNDLSKISDIEDGGNLLLEKNTLMVFGSNTITGYDVTNDNNPRKLWSMDFDQNTINTARLYNGKIYAVTQTYVGQGSPCPMPLYKKGSTTTKVNCTNIYRPDTIIASDSTFSVLKIDPLTGFVEDKISFMGSSGSTAVYMSDQNIYITYQNETGLAALYYGFVATSGSKLLPATTIAQIQRINGYDISAQSKLSETQLAVNNYKNTLSRNDQLTFENNFQNGLSAYTSEHLREVTSTGIIKIKVTSLDIETAAEIPGILLNQFSLDEYNNHLRVATTSGGRGFGNAESVNDIYILDEKLDIVGSVVDLGISERIFAARFIGNRGYLVTFRQIDPFYVLDLSDPSNPQVAGELKIPGYSSYLHPIADNLILGVGMDNNRVKASLFDVNNPSAPKELTKFSFNEYWSDVLNTHKAFLHDPENRIFFLPAGQGGYVMGYENNDLVIKKAISGINVNRAVFINNFLYILSDQKVVVLDENTWDTVNEIDI